MGVITCSFAHYAMDDRDEWLGDKFSYLITLLLTTAAFQYSMNEDLPKTPELTRIDSYILWAYLILAAQIVELAIASRLDAAYDLDDAAFVLNLIVGLGCVILWLFLTGRFVLGWKRYRNHQIDWKQLSDSELDSWCKDMAKSGSKSITVAKDHFYGSYDE